MATVDTPQFHWADYCVFALSLVASAGIGVFFACTGKKQGSLNEILMAEGKLQVSTNHEQSEISTC